jgi:hypothetical protein
MNLPYILREGRKMKMVIYTSGDDIDAVEYK